MRTRRHALVVGCALVIASCGGGSDEATPSSEAPTTEIDSTTAPTDPPSTEPVATDPPATDPPATEAPATDPPVTDPPTTEAPATTVAPEPDDTERIVATLASDELMGRQDQTEASTLAQDFLIGELEQFSDPMFEGDDGYRDTYDIGTNLLGVIPGGDLAGEYIVIGAHYDHLGNDCRDIGTDDDICNGATDNATGVAAAIALGRELADIGPRRSVVIALWDGEEDGLIGSQRYVDDPPVLLADTVAYINFDIQGSDLTPQLADSTVMVGAETGGPNLAAAAAAAIADSDLNTATFSLIFGQGRSDHANFAAAGVPAVFFTDANNGCYHTVKDDLDAVNFAKLDAQIATGLRLAIDLVDTDTPPVFDAAAPLTVFTDAVALLDLVQRAEPDYAILGPEGADEAAAFLVDLQAVVDAGEAGYGDEAIGAVLSGAVNFVDRLANAECLTAS